MSSAEVNSHFGLLGLGVAPRFLQKVRAFAEILTNKLGLFSAAQRLRPRAARVRILEEAKKIFGFKGGPK